MLEGLENNTPSVFSVPNYKPRQMAEQIRALLSDENRREEQVKWGKSLYFRAIWRAQAEKLEETRGRLKMKNKYRKKDHFCYNNIIALATFQSKQGYVNENPISLPFLRDTCLY